MQSPEDLLQKAKSLNKAKRYREVVDTLTDELLSNYNNADLYSEKAQALYRLKDYDACRTATEKALSINPNHPKGNHYQGALYYDQKEYGKAEEMYLKAIETDPGFAYPYNGLGNLHHDKKEYGKAEEMYLKAIETDPGFAYPYYGLGILYKDQKEYGKAEEMYLKAIETDPGFAYPYFGLGILYKDQKEYRKAHFYFSKYIEPTKRNTDFFTSKAKEELIEIKKITSYGNQFNEINNIVNQIKELLHFEKGCITHYTSLTVAKALVMQGSPFRLSEGAFLNDTSEGSELYDFLNLSLRSPLSNTETNADIFSKKPFIGSFVNEEKHDDLTLWRMYGKESNEEASGCSITIDMSKFLKVLIDNMLDGDSSNIDKSNADFNFYKVAYKGNDNNEFILPGAEVEENKKLKSLLSNLAEAVEKFNAQQKEVSDETRDVKELLNQIAYLFKGKEYQYEYEIRMVLEETGFELFFNEPNEPRVHINLVNIRPFITKITLGPKIKRADEWASVFYYSLKKDDLFPDIYISRLPFK